MNCMDETEIKSGDLVQYKKEHYWGRKRKVYLVRSVDTSNGWLNLVGVESVVFMNLMEKIHETR